MHQTRTTNPPAQQRGYRRARIALLLLASAMVWLLLGTSAPATHAQPGIQVLEQSATPDFPNSISFSLAAQSSGADITGVTLLYGAARTETLIMVELEDVAPGKMVEAEYLLNTQVFYFLPGTELHYRWLIADADGNEIETPTESLVYHDERFNWQERSERGVTVYWYRGNGAFGDALMETATDALDRLQESIGAEVVDPIKIYIYANSRDMRSAMQANEVEWVGGLADPGLGIILGVVPPGDVTEMQRIIPHELSHQVLHQATDNPYGGVPLWFNEGLAVYNQPVVDADFPFLVENAATSGQLISLEALASSFPADTIRARQSYAQSTSMVAYLFEQYGEEQVEQLVDAFEAAMPLDTALQQALGVTVDELDAEWRSTLPAATSVTTPIGSSQRTAPASRFRDAPVVP
jgi:hypothetical protein